MAKGRKNTNPWKKNARSNAKARAARAAAEKRRLNDFAAAIRKKFQSDGEE